METDPGMMLGFCIGVLDHMSLYMSFLDHVLDAALDATAALDGTVERLNLRLLEQVDGDLDAFVRFMHDGAVAATQLPGEELVEAAEFCATMDI